MIKETVKKIKQAQKNREYIYCLVLGETATSARGFIEEFSKVNNTSIYSTNRRSTQEIVMRTVKAGTFVFDIQPLDSARSFSRMRNYDFIFIENMEKVIKDVTDEIRKNGNIYGIVELLDIAERCFSRTSRQYESCENLFHGTGFESFDHVNYSYNQRFLDFNGKLPTLLEQAQVSGNLKVLMVSEKMQGNLKLLEKITEKYNQTVTKLNDINYITSDFTFTLSTWNDIEPKDTKDYDLVITDSFSHYDERRANNIAIDDEIQKYNSNHIDIFNIRYYL